MADKKAITKALKELEKRYGGRVVMKMNDANLDVETFSSGRDDLDIILGGGYAVGKIIEIYAESGCGKTGLALEAIASIQKDGGTVAIIDSEHALNTEYCQDLGVDVDELYISQPDYGEQAIETIRKLIECGEFDLIIVDSVAAMVPKAELEGESGEVKMGLHARMMSQGMKLISGAASNNDCTVIFINQLRSTISMYGPKFTTTGGKALKFYASQRLEIKNKGQIKEGDDIVGFKQYIKCVKNKVAPPFKDVENELIFGIGIDTFNGFVDGLIFNEIIEKRGGGYIYYGETKLCQGVPKLRILLDDNPDLMDELQKKLKES
jgi:recombination protein RecA